MKRLLRERTLVAVIILIAAAFAVFIVLPTVGVVRYPRFADYAEFAARPRWVRALYNTLFMAVISTVSATLVGFIFAYTTVRARTRLTGFLSNISILPMMSPPFIVALSYILLFGGHGLVTRSILRTHWNIYGWHGLWLVQTVSFFPYAFLVMASTLRRLNPTLEWAARSMGATSWTVFRTVTLPLLRPGIANAALLVAMNVLADFGNPIMIAGQFAVLPTEAYMQIAGWYDLAGASVLCSVLLVPAIVFFLLQKFWVGTRSYVTVTGRGSAMEPPPLPGPVNAALVAFCAGVTSVIVAVYGVLAYGSFCKTWGVDWRLSLQHLDYLFYRGVEIWNSLRFSLAAAVCCAALSVLSAYVINRRQFPGNRVLDFVALLPAAIPGVFLSVGYVLAFNTPPLAIAGTAWIIILIFVFWNLPMGYRAAVASLAQIDRSIEEAAANLGAGTLRTFKDIMVPLLRSPLAASFVVTFVRSVTALSVVIFVVSPGRMVATISILGLVEQGYWGRAAACTTCLVGIVFVVLGLGRLLTGGKAELVNL